MTELSEYEDLIIGTMRRWAEGEPVWSYQEIIDQWGKQFRLHRLRWGDLDEMKQEIEDHRKSGFKISIDHTVELFRLRNLAIKEFGFCLPCKELLDALAECQPIVEIGAGSGYMTRLMRNRGIEVVGTDSGTGGYFFQVGRYDGLQKKMAGKTAVRRYRDSTVFCSWPSLYQTWFRQALRAMRIGQAAIIIEEDACAEDHTWEYRDKSFDLAAGILIPAWEYMNDRCGVWVKKRHHIMRPPTYLQEQARRHKMDERMKKFSERVGQGEDTDKVVKEVFSDE